MASNLPILLSAQWLKDNFQDPNLVILDATIPKVGQKDYQPISEVPTIPGTRHFNLKGPFLDKTNPLPNTIPSPAQFEKACQALGISDHHTLILFDRHGVYSSPRAWWLLHAMGKKNIHILSGGLPAWKNLDFPTENYAPYAGDNGNFRAIFNAQKFSSRTQILKNLHTEGLKILDARSAGRFTGQAPEPRKGLLSGHIPGSISLPHGQLKDSTTYKNADELGKIIDSVASKNDHIICTCGSGITACIIAVAAQIAGHSNISIYDGSWSEWGQYGPAS